METNLMLETPMEQAATAPVEKPFPAPSLEASVIDSNFKQQVNQASANLNNEESAEGAEPTTPSTDTPTEAPVQSKEFPLTVAEELAIYEQEKLASAPEPVDDTVQDPIEVDQEAMDFNHNTTLDQASLDTERAAGLENIGEKEEGEAVYNTDLLDAVEAGDKQKAVKEELRSYLAGKAGGFLTNTFRVIDYVFAPTMAPLAAVEGALANQVNTGSFLGDLAGNAAAAGEAANERLFRWFSGDGGFMPDYAEKIVERYIPGIPEEHRSTAGVAIEMVLSLPMSFGMAGAMQKAISLTNSLDRTQTFGGLMQEAVYGALGWKPTDKIITSSTKALLEESRREGTDIEKLQAITRDIELQGQGDEAAFMRLSEDLSGVPGTNVMGAEEAKTMMGRVMGGVDQPSILVKQATEDGAIDQFALALGLDRTEAANLVKFNQTNATTGDVFEETMDEAVARFSAKLKQEEGLNADIPVANSAGEFKSQSNAQTIARAQESQMQLEELMGIPLDRMNLGESTALKRISQSSMIQLLEYRAVMNAPGVSVVNQQTAKAAFAKQLVMHHMIGAKIKGWGSIQGQGLQSMRRDFYNKLFASTNTKVC